jgi:hypothetical protein
MSLDVHTVAVVPGTNLSANDRLHAGLLEGVANGVGSGAGAAVAVAVTGLKLPAKYTVVISPSQDATWYITAKTATSFTVNLLPRLASETLAAGTFDVAIFG